MAAALAYAGRASRSRSILQRR